MKLNARHLAAAMLLGPAMLAAQDQALPSAPSAVAAQRGFASASDVKFVEARGLRGVSAPGGRLSSEQKFSSFVEQSMSPYAAFSSVVAAGFRPSWNASPYPETYASRIGHTMADQTEQGFFTKFLLPTMLKQDPRYHPSDSTGKVGRASYAISRVLVGRNDNGKSTLNTSELLGSIIAASLSSTYHPIHRPTMGDTASRAAAGIGTDAGMNLLREFWPDIRDCVLDHGPKMMQTLVLRVNPRVQSGTDLNSSN